jgi:hypothetical protein
MLSSYKDKYIKYKNKYLELKNKIGGNDENVYHVRCTLENKNIILTLLLQLLTEYEFMQKIISLSTKSQPPIRKTFSFLSILNFSTYNTIKTKSLLNAEEMIECINLIKNYCSDDIIMLMEDYKTKLETVWNNCDKKILESNLIKSFYDSRNYSIYILLHTLQGYYNHTVTSTNNKIPPVLIYKLNNKIMDGHIFIHDFRSQNYLEAISIQSSLELLLNAKCNEKGAGISKLLFSYVIKKIIPKIPTAKYIIAFAWPDMSNILLNKFDFNTLIYKKCKNDDNVCIDYENFFIGSKNPDDIKNPILTKISEIYDQNSDEYKIYSKFYSFAKNINNKYIFTVKKINKNQTDKNEQSDTKEQSDKNEKSDTKEQSDTN